MLWQLFCSSRSHQVLTLFRFAAERGHLGAQVQLGYLLSSMGTLAREESVNWYLLAAEKGDDFNMHMLCAHYQAYGPQDQLHHWLQVLAEKDDEQSGLRLCDLKMKTRNEDDRKWVLDWCLACANRGLRVMGDAQLLWEVLFAASCR